MPDRHKQIYLSSDRDLVVQTAPGDSRAFEGLVERHAAEVLGIGERALKSRLHRARLRLAVTLRAGGDLKISDEEGGRP